MWASNLTQQAIEDLRDSFQTNTSEGSSDREIRSADEPECQLRELANSRQNGLMHTGTLPLAIAKDMFTDSSPLSLMASQILSKSRGR